MFGGPHLNRSRRQHASSYGLPITVLIIFPSLILYLTNDTTIGWNIHPVIDTMLLVLGIALTLSGLTLLFVTVRMFSNIGNGTLAPWAPPEKLVIEGLYARTRSPMISGVLIALLGEGFTFSSFWILFFFVFFTIGNHIYFIKSEEPGLVKRFGDAYIEYKENVPRWIPRRTPWTPDYESKES